MIGLGCIGCGTPFRRSSRGSNDAKKYCSRACAFKNIKAWLRPSPERKPKFCKVRPCVQCGVIVRPPRKHCAPCSAQISANPVARCCSACRKEEVGQYAKLCDVCRTSRAKARRQAFGKKQRQKYGKNWRTRARVLGVPWEKVDRVKVFERDGWRCQICLVDTPMVLMGTNSQTSPTLDHRLPISKGGPHTYANLQCACRACNTRKGDKTENPRGGLGPRIACIAGDRERSHSDKISDF